MAIDQNKLLGILEELTTIARNGQTFAENAYDKNRYNELLGKLSQLNGEIFDIEDGRELFPVSTDGLYITPKIGVNGIVLNKNQEVLLERRRDDKTWGLPGGWCEVGLSAEENLIKELKEETGFHVEVKDFIKMVSRMPSHKFPYTSYHALYKVNVLSGELTCSHESLEVAWLDPKSVTNWHYDHGEWVDYYLNNQ